MGVDAGWSQRALRRSQRCTKNGLCESLSNISENLCEKKMVTENAEKVTETHGEGHRERREGHRESRRNSSVNLSEKKRVTESAEKVTETHGERAMRISVKRRGSQRTQRGSQRTQRGSQRTQRRGSVNLSEKTLRISVKRL